MKTSDSLPIRTRFAPSPTGGLHVGAARTALFNFLYAKANQGSFIVRIEDTDQERSLPSAEEEIFSALEWLGIYADESPVAKGPHAPYRQSERLSIYQSYAKKLLEQGLVYPCFCSDEELAKKQEEAKVLGRPYIYDKKCSSLSSQEVLERQEKGEKYAIRFRVESGVVIIKDLVQGNVKFDTSLIGDFIITKSNGFPSYNYAVVIDDYEMKISHIIRGVGHLSNTPRQILIHQALGLPLPFYAHISEIVGKDRKKLSKRRADSSVLLFKDLGFLPTAFRNYMALLGWYPRDGKEFLPEKRLEEQFDLIHCSKSPAMFDFFTAEREDVKGIIEGSKNGHSSSFTPEEIRKITDKKSKLFWLNHLYLSRTPMDQLWKDAKIWISKDEELRQILIADETRVYQAFDSIRGYLGNLVELTPFLKELFRKEIKIHTPSTMEILTDPNGRMVAEEFAARMKNKNPQTPEDYTKLIMETGEKTDTKGRHLFMPIRVASTGSTEGLELPTLFSILGHQEISRRIGSVLGDLPSLSS